MKSATGSGVRESCLTPPASPLKPRAPPFASSTVWQPLNPRQGAILFTVLSMESHCRLQKPTRHPAFRFARSKPMASV